MRSEITSNSTEIIGRYPLRFLRKYAGRNLISAQSLYPFDDAIDQTIKLPPNRIPFSLSSENRVFGSRRIREHSLEESLAEFPSANLLSLAR